MYSRGASRVLTGVIAGVSLVALVLLLPPLQPEQDIVFPAGTIALRRVEAPFRFDVVDPVATEEARRKAGEEEPPVLLERASMADIADASLQKMFELAALSRSATPSEARDILSARLAAEVGVQLSSPSVQALLFNADFAAFRDDVRALIRAAYNDGVVRSTDILQHLENRRMALLGGQVKLMSSSGAMQTRYTTGNIRSVTDAVEFVRLELERTRRYPNVEDVPRLQLAEELARAVIDHNLVFLPEETERQRQAAMSKVEPIIVTVSKNELICGKGERVTPLQEAKLRKLAEELGPRRPLRYVGYVALSLVAMLAVGGFLRRYHPDSLHSSAMLFTIAASVIMVLIIAKVVAALRLAVPNLQELPYIVPVASVGILLTVLRSGRLAIFVVHITAALCGIVLGPDWNLRYVIVLAWPSILGIMGLSSIRKRTDPYLAGLKISFWTVLMILCLAIYDNPTWADFARNFRPHILTALLAGAANGVLSVALATLLLPVYETMLGVTTDLRLLELVSGHPLLKQLAERAPGTYHHSVMVATMAEAAADAIGANSLLCRVGAYYHDIGKTNNTQYFIENHPGSGDPRSPHERLKPIMSVRIIRNHVKDGLEMAEQHNLPEVIRAFIPEHHGTTVMTYFYSKALEQEGAARVRVDDFRYPGPKPQSIETAIVMIADTIEAASRTLDPRISEGQIMQFVRKVINDKFIDDQFDECDLTLRQLHLLAQSFARSLATILHRRIIYPDAPPASIDGRKSPIKEREKDKGVPRAEAAERAPSTTSNAPIAE